MINLNSISTPVYVVDENRIRENVEILDFVQKRTDCKILLALKGFAMFSLFPIIKEKLHGVCASSPHEARLGREEFGGEVHSFAAAYSDEDFTEIVKYSDHIVFNSYAQFSKFRNKLPFGVKVPEFGIRVNPEHRETETEIYDPCAPNSRLGVTIGNFKKDFKSLEGISGLHFHTLCEKNSDSLQRTLAVFEKKFGGYVKNLKWVNFGGGHHITRKDYDVDLLCRLITDFKNKYGVQVYLEPGEAIALNTGVLVSTVLDIINNGMDIAVLDTATPCHMPDVLEMPYRPQVEGASVKGDLPYTYRLAGKSCLAGDIVGDYSFSDELKPGDKIVFNDMAHYTMVKNTTFNGINLPSIAISRPDGSIELVKSFGYEDFKGRLS